MNLNVKHLRGCYDRQKLSVKQMIIALILFLLLISGEDCLLAQGAKPSRQVADKAWASRDYEKAYDNYNGLLLMYSRDPLYAYYTGACLIKLNRDPQRSVTLLRSALNSSPNVKTIPDEVWFYYGRALQMSGNFQDALSSYEKYSKIAGRKKTQEYNVQSYIDECFKNAGIEKPAGIKKNIKTARHGKESKKSKNEAEVYKRRVALVEKNKFLSDSLLFIADGIKKKIDTSPVEARGLMRSRIAELEIMAGRYTTSADSIRTILGDSYIEKKEIENRPVPDNQNKQADSLIIKTEKVPTEYDKQLTLAMKLQYSSDSLYRVAAGLRRQSENLSPAEKNALGDKAAKLEAEAQKNQSAADKIMMKLEPGMPDTEKVDTTDVTFDEATDEVKPVDVDTIKTKENVKIEQENDNPVNKILAVHEDLKDIKSFRILDKQTYSASNPVPVGPVMVNGLIYCIQLAAFKNQVSPAFFRNFYPVFGMINNTNGVTYYYTGMFRRHEDASSSLSAVRTNGFADAFVVAFIDNVQVSMDKAAQAESVWSGISLTSEKQSQQKDIKTEVADTVSLGTLIFRAEVLRSVRPVKSDVMDKIELLAGNKPLDIIKNNKGETIILIGKFITFESSEEYVSLLIRNGYNAAKTAAWVGNNEIPIEKAKELLKKVTDEAPAY